MSTSNQLTSIFCMILCFFLPFGFTVRMKCPSIVDIIFFGLSMASAKNLMFFLVPVVGKLKMVCNLNRKILTPFVSIGMIINCWPLNRFMLWNFVYAKWIVAMLMALFYHQISDTLTFASIILLRFFLAFSASVSTDILSMFRIITTTTNNNNMDNKTKKKRNDTKCNGFSQCRNVAIKTKLVSLLYFRCDWFLW